MKEPNLFDQICVPGALRVVYQPIFDVEGDLRRIHGFECLVRGPLGTPAERADFLFEYSRRLGREDELDFLAIDVSLASAGELPSQAVVSVNIHASTLCRGNDVVRYLAEKSGQAGIEPGRLVVEIIENNPNFEGARFLRAIARLRSEGFALAIDDVGRGSSNLRMLLDTRPDYMKIDRYFIHGCRNDPFQRAIVEAVMLIGDRFGSRVVAEGVEDPSDVEILREMGIGLVQGYLFSRPLPIEQIRGAEWN